MSSRCLSGWRRLLAIGGLLIGATAPAAADEKMLRVCADPDNLPYSKADESGFENRIAELVASDLNAALHYEWQAQGRGFVRKTLGAGLCDVFIGVPAGFDRVATTRPYYRSGYVFVSRAEGAPGLDSFEDPRLRTLSIGVQLIGDDLAATPPGHALVRRGATDRVVGYPVYGDGPAAERALRDLASGTLDAAVLWGPQAGYFAARSPVPMRMSSAQGPDGLAMPFEFSIAMGVRKGNTALREALDEVIERRGQEIAAILDAYAVPRRPLPPPPAHRTALPSATP
ncbi:MAG TPA: substrate-binding domain-containing protein [Caldimonas sp.]|jgi:mxaJ protein|nr:substrate-binding domain-containing protein [Caldimonas sp.]HEX2540208.1 substrate-binding domain-containing protein [Caldimonas sp.]